MSSFFVWGCCFGFLTRAATAKMGHQCLTASDLNKNNIYKNIRTLDLS